MGHGHSWEEPLPEVAELPLGASQAQITTWIRTELGVLDEPAPVDLPMLYGANNHLFNPLVGFVPTNVYARITAGLEAMPDACQNVWRFGSDGETLTFTRYEPPTPTVR